MLNLEKLKSVLTLFDNFSSECDTFRKKNLTKKLKFAKIETVLTKPRCQIPMHAPRKRGLSMLSFRMRDVDIAVDVSLDKFVDK